MLIDSAEFKESTGHENPGQMPYESEVFVARSVSLGAFQLSPSLINEIADFVPVPIGSDTSIPDALKDKIQVMDGSFFIGSNSANPEIGDMRVRFSAANPTDISVIAVQYGTSFKPYIAKAGGRIELLQPGTHTAEEMIQQAQESNKMLTLILRIVGFIIMLIGFNAVFKVLSVLADVIPFLGNVVGFGTGVVAFMLSVTLTLITMAIAWLFYRPLLGIGLLVIAGVLIVVLKLKLGKVKTTA